MLINKRHLATNGNYGYIDHPLEQHIKHEKLGAAVRRVQDISPIAPRYYKTYTLYYDLTKELRRYYQRGLICL